MPRPTTTFSLEDQPEVFFSTTATSRAIRRHLAAGQVRQIEGRLYTRNVTDPLEVIVRRRAWDVAAGYFPGAVIVDRTAFQLQPLGPEGSLFLSSGTRRSVRLPGLVLNCRRDTGPVAGDQPFLGDGLFLSSWPRRFLDNMRPSRARGGISRTLSRAEIEEQLEIVLVNQGEAELGRLRDEARLVADELRAHDEYRALDMLIGTLLGTKSGSLTSRRVRATAAGIGWDEQRIPLFDTLLAALNAHTPVNRPERPDHSGPAFAFFEAYFSNFIEGTEFLVSEAEDIVFRGTVPSERPADAHDVLGTYEVVSDPIARARIPGDAESLEEILRSTHARMLAARREASPGTYKTIANRAGQTIFVAPRLIRGTLAQGLDRYLALPPGFQRAAFAMFLISEVHPFADGNGRVARVLANAELSSARQQRLIIPTALRDDYLHALRAMSRQANPIPLVRILDRAQELCFQLDWAGLDRAEAQLAQVHAFETPADAEAAGVVLRLPSEQR
jgi:Fic/DOC family